MSQSNCPRVALVRCPDYDPEQVFQALQEGLALLGGVERFVRPGEHVLLKPNLLTGSPPERAVTTHPAVFAAVTRALRAAGVELAYGDSPGMGVPVAAARRSGIVRVAEELGVALGDFTHGREVSFPEGRLVKRFTLAPAALEADAIVSLPKLKTHGLMRLTGAIKNQFGCIPGMLKAEFHARLPNVDYFAQMLVDLNRLLRPRLYVMDGIVAMEGNGPRNGDPRPMGVLLLSDDPVALDATASRLINLDPQLVLTTRWGEAWGLGVAREVEVVGEPLESLVVSDFVVNRHPGPTTGEQTWRGRLVKNLFVPRPVIVEERCTRCGTCVRVCPVTPKAVTFVSEDGPPVHDYGRCIRCYCCQEMCPERAILIETPLLGRLLHRRS